MAYSYQNLIKEVKDYLEEQLKKHLPEVKSEDLFDDGAVFYQNGNDGTDFDWAMNDRTCEFFKFYKSTEHGAIKVYATKKGTLEGYCWGDEGKGQGIALEPKKISTAKAAALKKFLYHYRDLEDIWDTHI